MSCQLERRSAISEDNFCQVDTNSGIESYHQAPLVVSVQQTPHVRTPYDKTPNDKNPSNGETCAFKNRLNQWILFTNTFIKIDCLHTVCVYFTFTDTAN